MWNWLKSEVYKPPDTREDITIASPIPIIIGLIVNACAKVKENMTELRPATQQLSARAAKSFEVGGGVFEHIL